MNVSMSVLSVHLSVCLKAVIFYSLCVSACQAEDNQNKADHLYELKMRELDQRACELQHAEEECRRAINEATKNYNLAQVFISIRKMLRIMMIGVREPKE